MDSASEVVLRVLPYGFSCFQSFGISSEVSLMEFECVRKKFLPQHSSVNSKQQGICHSSDNLVKIPLVSIGPSGIGGEYQRET